MAERCLQYTSAKREGERGAWKNEPLVNTRSICALLIFGMAKGNF